MASSTQDEEGHHRMEYDALDDEAKTTDDDTKHEDDDKIVSSESSTSEADMKIMEQEDDDKIVASESVEPEVKDTNQEDESRGGMMVVPSTTTTTTTTSPRSLAQNEEKAREDDARTSLIQPKNPSVVEVDDYEEDDSEQTLRFLSRWRAPEIPPEKIIHRSLVEQCSRPIQKQLTTSDAREKTLSLPNSQVRKKFHQLLGESEATRGRNKTRVSVYGPDGKVQGIWLGDEERSFELRTGWRKFVMNYGLKECCDFVTVWMFRHSVTQRICLAIDVIRFSFRNQVSKRISEAALEDSD